MKIVDRPQKFTSLSGGDVFRYRGTLWLKFEGPLFANQQGGQIHNATSLETGSTTFVSSEEVIHPVPGQFTVST